MDLHYLDFDYSEDAQGRGSFDAMASVPESSLPALRTEIVQVLRWAHEQFGDPAHAEDDLTWGYDLHGLEARETVLEAHVDRSSGALSLAARGEPSRRVTLTLTLVGPASFCEAFRSAFGLHGG